MMPFLQKNHYYNAVITEVFYKEIGTDKKIPFSVYESRGWDIVSALAYERQSLDATLEHIELSNEASLDDVKSVLRGLMLRIDKIQELENETQKKEEEYKAKYERVEEQYHLPFLVNSIIVYDDENISEPERELESDKECRKNGAVDSNYHIEYNLSHCGLDESEAINNFVEITDEKEIEKAKKNIAKFLRYESDMQDMAEAQHC